MNMKVTIDGPCGSGKSTVARELAGRLEFDYLDTGAMYRAVTWKAVEEEVDLEGSPDSIIRIAGDIRIDFHPAADGRRVLCDGRDVTLAIRSPEVTRMIKYVADVPQVREAMVRLQRRYAEREGDIVTEGRDQGSVVFPDAEVKFYLDADVRTRAKRRMEDFRRRGIECELREVIADIRERDRADRERPVGGLRCTDSMIVVDSTDKGVEQVVEIMAEIVSQVETGSSES